MVLTNIHDFCFLFKITSDCGPSVRTTSVAQNINYVLKRAAFMLTVLIVAARQNHLSGSNLRLWVIVRTSSCGMAG